MNDWNFEVFSMNECSDGQALRYLGFELMQKFNILQKFKVKYFLFIKIIGIQFQLKMKCVFLDS
jgi:hypothetical protein